MGQQSFANDRSLQYYPPVNNNKKAFNILWVGKFDFRKQLGLAIRTVAATHNQDILLHVCGTGTVNEIAAFHTLAEAEGISEQVKFHGKIPHNEIDLLMKSADLFFFTSIMEATSTVVLEAISAGLPILSFNTCGFGPLVKEFAGYAIEVSTPDTAIHEFVRIINDLHKHPAKLAKISRCEQANRVRLSWEGKALEMVDIYKRVLGY